MAVPHRDCGLFIAAAHNKNLTDIVISLPDYLIKNINLNIADNTHLKINCEFKLYSKEF